MTVQNNDFADLRPEPVARVTPDYQRPRKSEPAHVPQLKATITIDLKVTQSIDILAYFRSLDAREQARYAEVACGNDEDGEFADWEAPLQFLWPEEDFGGGEIPWSFIPEVTTGGGVDVDDIDFEVRYRTGLTHGCYGSDSRWSPEDFQTLRDNVPWLDAVHREIEEQDPEIIETNLSRVPGPLDTPLNFETQEVTP